MDQQLDLFNPITTAVGGGVTQAEDFLPPQAREILGLIGCEALVRLVNTRGGVHIDFPRHVRNFDKSKIVTELGDDIGEGAAKRLAEHFAGVRLHVPKCDRAVQRVRDEKIRQSLDAGESAAELARRHRLTERRIWDIAKQV